MINAKVIIDLNVEEEDGVTKEMKYDKAQKILEKHMQDAAQKLMDQGFEIANLDSDVDYII